MVWFDLIDEILVTILTVPLFSLLKTNVTSKEKNGLVFIISFSIYTIFALIISTYVSNITEFMNVEFAAEYLKLQTFSLLLGFISTFCIILLTLNNDFKMVAILTIVKLAILSIWDFVFIDAFLEVGASYSEIITNSLIGIIALIIVYIRKYIGFGNVFHMLISIFLYKIEIKKKIKGVIYEKRKTNKKNQYFGCNSNIFILITCSGNGTGNVYRGNGESNCVR